MADDCSLHTGESPEKFCAAHKQLGLRLILQYIDLNPGGTKWTRNKPRLKPCT